MSTLNDIRARFAAAILNEKRSKVQPSQTNLDRISNPYIKEKMENDSSFFSELTDFMFYLPEGLITTAFLDFLNKLGEKESEDLIELLNSLNSIEQVERVNYSSGLLKKLFQLKETGIGRGEIMLSWIVKGARINGGGESYDMSLNGEKYELKEVKPNTAFRLGQEGNITQMDFYKEFKDTIRRMENLGRDNKFDLEKYMTKEEWSAWKDITDYDISKIMSGEIGYERIDKLKRFYEIVNKGNDLEVEGFTNLILRGPNVRPVELSIEPYIKSKDNLKPGDIISVKISSADSSRTYIMSELRRLKYVRQPEMLNVDIQGEINKIINSKSFILFGPKSAKVTKNVKFDRISQGSIKLKEA